MQTNNKTSSKCDERWSAINKIKLDLMIAINNIVRFKCNVIGLKLANCTFIGIYVAFLLVWWEFYGNLLWENIVGCEKKIKVNFSRKVILPKYKWCEKLI